MSGDGLSQGIGPAAKIALRGAAAEDDEDAAALWCSRLAGFGLVEAARDHFRPAAGEGDLGSRLSRAGRREEAMSWYRRAAEAGAGGAAEQLAGLLADAGRTEEAEVWRARSAARR